MLANLGWGVGVATGKKATDSYCSYPKISSFLWICAFQFVVSFWSISRTLKWPFLTILSSFIFLLLLFWKEYLSTSLPSQSQNLHHLHVHMCSVFWFQATLTTALSEQVLGHKQLFLGQMLLFFPRQILTWKHFIIFCWFPSDYCATDLRSASSPTLCICLSLLPLHKQMSTNPETRVMEHWWEFS